MRLKVNMSTLKIASSFNFPLVLLSLKLIFVSVIDGSSNSYKSKDVLEKIQDSCFFLLNQRSDLKLHSVFDQLASVYIDDRHVAVGIMQEENFIWPNGARLRLKGIIDKWYLPKHNDILIFEKQKVDRTCLLENKFPVNPLPELYTGGHQLDSMIEFINLRCLSYRDIEGKINAQGVHREIIKSSFFSVGSLSNASMGQIFENSGSCEQKFKYSSLSNSSKFNKHLTPVTSKIAKCDRINSTIDRETFFNSFLKLSKPVVLENATILWPAFKKWTNEYLRKKYGSKKVHVKLTPGGDFEGVEKAELWENYHTFKIPEYVKKQLEYPDLVVVRPAGIDMTFSEFLDLITWAAEQANRNVSAYLEYSSIPNYMPELEEDILEPIFANFLKRAHLNMWLSDGHTLGRLHFDPYDNFLCQVCNARL